MICPQINSLSSGKSLRVACSINQEQVYAIVDTAADVSLISESLYLRLAKEVPIIRQANLAAAGQGQVITAKQIGPVDIHVSLGTTMFSTTLYAALINDDMLLGMDILKRFGAKIDVGKPGLEWDGQVIPLVTASEVTQLLHMKENGKGKPDIEDAKEGTEVNGTSKNCIVYTSDEADERTSVGHD